MLGATFDFVLIIYFLGFLYFFFILLTEHDWFLFFLITGHD